MANTNPRFVSPVGIAQYPYLHKPDIKFNPDGEYKTTLRVKKEHAKDIITRIDWYICKDGNFSRMYMNNKVKIIPIDCHVRRSRPKKRPLIFSGIIGCSRANQFPRVMALPTPNKTIPVPIIQI